METLPIKTTIRQVGNSTGVIISKKLLDHYGFNEGDHVEIVVKKANLTNALSRILSRVALFFKYLVGVCSSVDRS